MHEAFFSILGLIVPFDKFEVDILQELNFAPTQLHPNVEALTICATSSLLTPISLHFYITIM